MADAADQIKEIGHTYLYPVPAATARVQVNVPQVQDDCRDVTVLTAQPRQRIPLHLPEFSGKTTDYLHFKTVFTKLVTYENEIDKVMALTKSLMKQSDKNRVSKELTLAACFVKLDEDYGDLTTLANECTSMIENITYQYLW